MGNQFLRYSVNGIPVGCGLARGFDVFVTADKNMRYQQNLSGCRIGLVVLSTPQWPVVKLNLEKIAAVVTAATPGSYAEVEFETPRKAP